MQTPVHCWMSSLVKVNFGLVFYDGSAHVSFIRFKNVCNDTASLFDRVVAEPACVGKRASREFESLYAITLEGIPNFSSSRLF